MHPYSTYNLFSAALSELRRYRTEGLEHSPEARAAHERVLSYFDLLPREFKTLALELAGDDLVVVDVPKA